MVALPLCSFKSSRHVLSFSSLISEVLLKTMALAFSTWSLKNSPKFFIYILHLLASTTAQKPSSSISLESMRKTALITSLSFPTPEGSIKILSGEKSERTFLRAFPKSPTRLQQMQPEFISVISTPASCKNPPSTPISPNSFSIRTIFSPAYASLISFFIRVVFPAPKNPEKISILDITIPLFF